MGEIPATISRKWVVEEVDDILQILKSGVQEVCPLVDKNPRSRKQPFWTQGLTTQKASARAAYRRYKRIRLLEDWDSYILERRKFRGDLRKEKKKSWRAFLAELKDPKKTAQMFKSLQKLSLIHI